MPIFPAPLNVPLGTLTSLGIGKEGGTSQFGIFASPTVWHSFKNFAPSGTNDVIPRTGARKRYGQSEPITGGYDFTATLDVESDPDTVTQMWSYAMGSQTTPSHNIVATTVATGGSLTGATAIPLTSTLGIQIGCSLVVDTAANQETVVVSNVTATGIITVAATTHAHTAGATVTLTSASAFISNLIFGAVPSFSMEVDMQTDVFQYIGCMVDSFMIDVPAGGEVGSTFTLVGAWEQIKGSAAVSPTYSILKPLSTVDSRNNVIIASTAVGEIGQLGVLKASFSVANNLKKGYRSVGSGRRVTYFPQLQRKVTGSLDLGFETDMAYKAFLGGISATSPQNDVPGVSINVLLIAPGTVDSTLGLQYSANIIVGDAKFTKLGSKVVSNDMITQTVSWEASETSNQANNDISISFTNGASVAY